MSAAVCATLAVLMGAPNAHAGWKVYRAQAIAEHVWSYDYGCDDGVSIRWEDPAPAFGAAVTAEQRARSREVLAWVDLAAPPAARCVVYFNGPRRDFWGVVDWTETCSAMIHEYGHLAGFYSAAGVRKSDGTIDHAHSPDPRSIMYPDYQPDRRCRKRGRPYLDRYELI